ncbi:precorrin-3B C(17)-methyltransferase [Spirochaetia bacterium]|nr:precorrin-3B C(17)-methyltransferase [Spirochaetia bacterium]
MKLFVVGIGPGDHQFLTEQARNALSISEVIAGYPLYIELIKDLIGNKETIATGMRKETERCRSALESAAAGKVTALVCSGDAGVYGMASLVLELAKDFPSVEIVIVPGLSAALTGAAVLGSPLSCDFAVISLSDLLVSWEKIEQRLHGAASGGFVICLYNPSSHKRSDYLERACSIVLQHRSPAVVCGIVRNIGRNGEESRLLTLSELKTTDVDMFTTVFIGNDTTENINGKMVTLRGYHAKGD